MPFALAYLGFLHGVLGRPLPVPNMSFAVWAMVGAMAQIAATFLLVHLFSFRNFAVGTAYSRTEPAQAALFALIFVGESVNGGTLAAIAISVAGVMLISVARTEVTPASILTSIFSRTAGIGLASGAFRPVVCRLPFGLAGASTQPAGTGCGDAGRLYPRRCHRDADLGDVLVDRMAGEGRIAADREGVETVACGRFRGATASFGWFTAMTLQQAAVVKALAQVEMLFAFASTVLSSRKRSTGLNFRAAC